MKILSYAAALIVFFGAFIGAKAENAAVTQMLKGKYQSVLSSDYPSSSKLKGNYYIVSNLVDGNIFHGICDGHGNEIFPTKYRNVTFMHNCYTLSTGDKVEIYDTDRKLVHTVHGYPRVSCFNPDAGRIVVSDGKEKYGVIDLKGNVIIPVQYSYIYDMTIELPSYDDPLPLYGISVKVGGKTLSGIADRNGNILLKPEYDGVSRTSLAKEFRLTKDGKEGRASYEGKLIVPAGKYTKVNNPDSRNGYRLAYIDDTTVVLDPEGKEVMQLPGYDIKDIADVIEKRPFIKVGKGDKVGFYSLTAGEVVPPVYDEADLRTIDDVPRLFLVRDGKNVGAIGLDGKTVVPVKYPLLDMDRNGVLVGVNYSAKFDTASYYLLEAPAGTQWGYYDFKGNEVLPPEYAYIQESEGLLLVNRGGTTAALKYSFSKDKVSGGAWGFMDREGREVVPVEYQALSAFSGGVANGVKDGIATAIPHPTKGTSLKIANGGASAFNSPVDKDIPKAAKPDAEIFAFIFAAENYNNYGGADCALRDGETFRQYCETTLGAPAKNVRVFNDATFANIKSNLKKISEIAEVYDGDAKFIIYFAGLGTADATSGHPFFLPADAVPSAVQQTAIDLDAFTAELEQIAAKWMLVLVDAPTNGNNRLGKPLGEGRGVRIKAKPAEPKGAVIVCRAAAGDADATVDSASGHGLLTVEFLDNLRQNPQPQSIIERLEAVSASMRRKSLEGSGNIQTPEIKIGGHPSINSAKL